MRQSIHTITLIALAGLLSALPSFGDDATAPAPGSSAPGGAAPPSGMVALNFPQAVSLEVMVNDVSKRLGMNILYDEQVTKQKVTPPEMRSSKAVRVDSLPGLLDQF